MIAFCLHDQVHSIIKFIKFPNYVRNLGQRFRYRKIIFGDRHGNRLIVKIVHLLGSVAIKMWIKKTEMMANKNIVHTFILFLSTNLAKYFRFLGREYPQALNALHVRFPLFKVGEVVKLINNPFK